MTFRLPASPVLIPRPVPVPGMVDLATAEVLWSASRALSADAEEVRALAARVALVAGLDWRGRAAESFREAVTERVGSVRHAAVLVGDLAAALQAAATEPVA